MQRNTELFKAGRSNRDIGNDAWQLPESIQQNQLPSLSQRIGQCNEYPIIMNPQWFESSEHNGECQPRMIFCVESYVGSAGGCEGVKLEQQIMVTESGYEILSDMGFDEDLVG